MGDFGRAGLGGELRRIVKFSHYLCLKQVIGRLTDPHLAANVRHPLARLHRVLGQEGVMFIILIWIFLRKLLLVVYSQFVTESQS